MKIIARTRLWTLGFGLFALTIGSSLLAQDKPDTKIVPPEWTSLKEAYSYDKNKPLLPTVESKPATDVMALHLSFTGANGKPVPGGFLRPKAEGVYPVILLLHGLTSDKDTMLKGFGIPLVMHGVAVLALDAPHHGELKVEGERQADPINFASAVHEGCINYRRALDWLSTRKDVDMKHVGLIGYSMGAMMGSILGAVDDRINAFALCVGGDPVLPLTAVLGPEVRNSVYSICTSLYIAHIAPRPILMLNGKQDTTMPEAASKRLYEAAKEPKQQLLFDSGHLLPKEALEKAISWILEKEKEEAQNASSSPSK